MFFAALMDLTRRLDEFLATIGDEEADAFNHEFVPACRRVRVSSRIGCSDPIAEVVVEARFLMILATLQLLLSSFF